MLTKILLVLRRFALLISISYTILLVLVSFISLDDFAEIEVDKGDKIFHFLVYFILVVLWYIALIEKVTWSKSKQIIIIAFCSIMFGIIIEILQGSLTSYRAADGFDILANTLGVLLASASIWFNNRNVKKK